MRIKIEHSKTAIECFEDFLLNKKARGIADKTLKSYADHFHAAGIYIDWSKPIPEIDKQLYAKYGLTDDEVAFIESMIKAME